VSHLVLTDLKKEKKKEKRKMASDLSFLDDAEKAAVCAARSAGDILRSYWEKGRESFSVEFKSSTDLVTEADKKSEAVVMATLRRLFARDAAFLCEESGASEAKGEGAQYRWIVDPLGERDEE
jgi:myo-inositol-1(or 4)-monophosphatase